MTTSWVGVLPFIHRPWAEACRATMHPAFLNNVSFVDNTRTNIGIMAAHNQGVDRMRETGADWLVVLSAAVRFGAPGGLDFIAALDGLPDHMVVEGPARTHDSGGNGVYGWHLIAFNRRCLDAVGRWDENFTPYGFDDLDMSLRIQRVFGDDGKLWTKAPTDVTDAGMGHSIHLGGVRTDTNALIGYFQRKWGRHPGASTEPAYDRPFNDPTNPVWYWPPTPSGGTCG